MAPIRASEGMDSADALASVKPNVDCAVCDKAHFKRGTFKRNDVHAHADEAPCWTCYVDGYGGQESMGGESYGGAIGGFVFYCRSTKTLTNKLYASTEQFPMLLYQFLQDVERQYFAGGGRCGCVVSGEDNTYLSGHTSGARFCGIWGASDCRAFERIHDGRATSAERVMGTSGFVGGLGS